MMRIGRLLVGGPWSSRHYYSSLLLKAEPGISQNFQFPRFSSHTREVWAQAEILIAMSRTTLDLGDGWAAAGNGVRTAGQSAEQDVRRPLLLVEGQRRRHADIIEDKAQNAF
jgi:hypothetical protein